MPTDQTIELELQLKDSASATIKAIAASMSEVVKHLGEMGKASTGTDSGIASTVKGVTQLADKSKETTKSLTSMAAVLASMAGPAGTAEPCHIHSEISGWVLERKRIGSVLVTPSQLSQLSGGTEKLLR
jgi:hypothetical protein